MIQSAASGSGGLRPLRQLRAAAAARRQGGTAEPAGRRHGVLRLLLLGMLARVAGQGQAAACVDTDGRWMDRLGNRCWEYEGKEWCSTQPFPADVPASEACCVCGGGIFPEPEPEPEPGPEPEPEPEPEPLADCVEEPGGPEFKTCTDYLAEGYTCEELRSLAWQSPTAEQSLLGVDTVSFGCCACDCSEGEGPSYYGYCEQCPVNTYSPDGSAPFVYTDDGIYRNLLPQRGCRACTVCEPGSMHFESQLDGCLCMTEWSAGYPCNPNDKYRGCPAVPCDLGNPQGVGDGGVAGQSWCLTNISASPAYCAGNLGACNGGARCSVTTDTVCTGCANGTFSEGGPACEVCAPPCPNGQHEASSCTLSTNRVCEYCSPEEYGDGVDCHVRTVCVNGVHILRPPEPHEDRVCVQCAPGKYSSSPNDMACFECPDGFRAADDGGSCEDANECELLQDACANGGTCFESTTHYPLVDYNTFACTCVAPYYGEGCRCRTIADGSRTCCDTCSTAGDGVCDDGGPPPEMCTVRSSFCADVPTCMLGTDCEDCGIRDAPANPCDSEPCGTTGFCDQVELILPGDVGYECTCVTGWQGFLCDDDIDECLSVPCLNGGVCTGVEAIRGTGYSCDCAGTGWEGQHCDLEPIEGSEYSGTDSSTPPAPGGGRSPGQACEDLHVSCSMLATAADCFNSMDSDWRLYNCARSCLQCPASVELSFAIDVEAIGGSGSPTRVQFVRNLVYSFAEAAAVDASRVTLTELRGGSVTATLRVGGVTKASEPSASVAVVELQSLHAANEFSLGPDLSILSMSVSGVVPVDEEVEWARDWADVRAELAQQPEPEPEPEPQRTDEGIGVGYSQGGSVSPAEGSPLGAIGGAAGAAAALALLVGWLRARSRGGSVVHPTSPANKLGSFAETALSEDANRTVAMAMFRRIDLDGNGSVDRREVQKLCESEGLGYHGTIMREMDADRSGEVSLEEFCAWWTKHNPVEETKPSPGDERHSVDNTLLESPMPEKGTGVEAPRRHTGDIDSDGEDDRKEQQEEEQAESSDVQDIRSPGGSRRARPKSANTAAASSRGGKRSKSRPHSASVHGRSAQRYREDDDESDGGGERDGQRRPQSARPASSSRSRSKGHSRRRNHANDENESDEKNDSKRLSSSRRRPQSASASAQRRHGRSSAVSSGGSRSKRPQSASVAERRSGGDEGDAWEGLLDADDGLSAEDERDGGNGHSDAEEGEPTAEISPPRGRSRRPQSAPASRERRGGGSGSSEGRRKKGERPSSGRDGGSRRGISSRVEEISRELDSVNEEAVDGPEENQTAAAAATSFQPSSLGDLPPLAGSLQDNPSGSSGSGRRQRPQSSSSSRRSRDRGGASAKRSGRSRKQQLEPHAESEPEAATPAGLEQQGPSARPSRSSRDSKGKKKKSNGSRSHTSSSSSSSSSSDRRHAHAEGDGTGEGSSDDEPGGGPLAGGSLSVAEMEAQRQQREKKAQRAAAKKSKRGGKSAGPRPPSAASQQLRGNSDFLANELGITKRPAKRQHR